MSRRRKQRRCVGIDNPVVVSGVATERDVRLNARIVESIGKHLLEIGAQANGVHSLGYGHVVDELVNGGGPSLAHERVVEIGDGSEGRKERTCGGGLPPEADWCPLPSVSRFIRDVAERRVQCGRY